MTQMCSETKCICVCRCNRKSSTFKWNIPEKNPWYNN